MAQIPELTEHMKDPVWIEWYAERPEHIKKMIDRFPPDRLFRMKESGNRCTLHGWSENGTLIVTVSGEYNYIAFPRNVFGVNPDDLTECDLPAADEKLGVYLNKEQQEELIKSMRQEYMKSN